MPLDAHHDPAADATTQPRYEYIYAGSVFHEDRAHDVEGTATSLSRCDRTRLMACMIRDLSRTHDLSQDDAVVVDFAFSEIVTRDMNVIGPPHVPALPDAHPDRTAGQPSGRDTD